MSITSETENAIEDFQAILELKGEKCHLKHSPHDLAENHQAVDFICQDIGREIMTDDGIMVEVLEATLRIPICKECAEALYGDDWVLLYCVGCNNSQWVCKRLSSRVYADGLHIKWVDMCPNCYNKI